MSRFNRFPSAEYSEFKKTVQEYAQSEHEPSEDVYRVIADALEDNLRERFISYWGVDTPADTACIRRIITGETECQCEQSWIDREREKIGARDEPPHSPPYSDHATLWMSDEKPVLYSMHVSSPEAETASKTAAPEGEQLRNGWFDIVAFAEEWGLEVGVTPFSWYNLFSTVNVVFFSPEWSRQKTEE